MATDVLILGGFIFTGFAVPERIPFGGDQAMVVHKLPGGRRVIDTLGPDDMDIEWHGRFWGSYALTQAMSLDAMRRAGTVLPLSYAGHNYTVVINHFVAEIERAPQDVLYQISCTVLTNDPSMVAPISGSALAALDIAAALSI